MYSGEAKLANGVDDRITSNEHNRTLESVEGAHCSNIPPEVLLDRYIRSKLRRVKGIESYRGKQNLGVLQAAFTSLLLGIQTTLNEGLRGLPVPRRQVRRHKAYSLSR